MKPIRHESPSACPPRASSDGRRLSLVRPLTGLLALLLASGSLAVGLGKLTGSATVGEPLALRIPVFGEDAARLMPDCIQLDRQPGIEAGFPLADAQVQLEGTAGERYLSVRSTRPVSDPVVVFGIRIGCGHGLSRPYQMLVQAPRAAAQLPLQEAAPPASAVPESKSVMPQGTPSAAAPFKPVAPARLAGGQLVVEQATTLRLISRHRFPASGRARVRFIERIAAANPQRFADVKSAYDAPLLAQEALALPAKEELAISAPVVKATEMPSSGEPPRAKKPTTEAAGTVAAPARQGRLIIGVDELPRRTLRELQGDLDRLVEINNEQVLVQIALLERIKQLEQGLGEMKQWQAEQQAVNQRLREEIRSIKEESRDGFILLGIALLVLGAIIGLLLHRLHVRTGQLAEQSWQRPALLDPLPEAFTAKTVKAFKSLYHGR